MQEALLREEFLLVLECKVVEVNELGLHTMFVGEILDVKADESALDDEGRLDIKRVMPFVYAPENRAYFGIGENIGQAFSIGRQIGRREGLV